MTIHCKYLETPFTVSADFAQASSPILVDDCQIGRQVADARHRCEIAVAIAANYLFSLGIPEAPAGITPREWKERIRGCDAWDDISYEFAE